jgi:hypothetical protein
VETVFSMNDKFSAPLEKIKAKTAGIGKIFAGAFGAGLAMKGLEGIGRAAKTAIEQLPEFAEKADQIERFSQISGIGADALQRFQYAAKMADVPAETLEGALKKMSVGMAQLEKHQGPLEKGLRRINPGLMMQLRNVKDNKTAFLLVADAVQKARTAQERAAIAQAAFGKTGQELIPMLMKGKAGLSEMMKEADKYGSVIDGPALEAGKKLADNLKHLRGTIDGVKNTVLGSLTEAIQPFVDKISEWAAGNRALIATKVELVIRKVGDAALWLYRNSSWLVPTVLTLVGAFEALVLVSKIITAVQIVMNSAFLANPITWVVIAVVALVAGFVILTQKIGGVGNAFRFLGGVIMATLLAPVNLVIDAIKALLGLVSLIPGVGTKLKPALDAINGFQSGMNKTLTGSDKETDFAGIWNANKAPNDAAIQAGGSHHILDIAGAPKDSKLTTTRAAPDFTANLAWGQN